VPVALHFPPQLATGTSCQTARYSRHSFGHLYRLPSKLARLRHHRPAVLVCCCNRLGCLQRCSCDRLCILLAASFGQLLRRDPELPLPGLRQSVETHGSSVIFADCCCNWAGALPIRLTSSGTPVCFLGTGRQNAARLSLLPCCLCGCAGAVLPVAPTASAAVPLPFCAEDGADVLALPPLCARSCPQMSSTRLACLEARAAAMPSATAARRLTPVLGNMSRSRGAHPSTIASDLQSVAANLQTLLALAALFVHAVIGSSCGRVGPYSVGIIV
jgi:hypothetical protein